MDNAVAMEAQTHEPRREIMSFMRWGDAGGIESYEREVVWVREVRARVFAEGGSVQSEHLPSGVFLSAVDKAVAEARGLGGATVTAEQWDVPHLADPRDGLAPIPPDWFIQENFALGVWLSAASHNRQVEDPAMRVYPRLLSAAVVWRRGARFCDNVKALEGFASSCQDEAASVADAIH